MTHGGLEPAEKVSRNILMALYFANFKVGKLFENRLASDDKCICALTLFLLLNSLTFDYSHLNIWEETLNKFDSMKNTSFGSDLGRKKTFLIKG